MFHTSYEKCSLAYEKLSQETVLSWLHDMIVKIYGQELVKFLTKNCILYMSLLLLILTNDICITRETYVGVLPQIELVHLNMTSLRSLLSPDPVAGSLTTP